MRAAPLQNLPQKLPRSFSLELTAKCNYNCPYCYCLWHEFPELAKRELTTEEWAEVICFLTEQGVDDILFTGGEALLHPGIKELILLARKKLPSGTLSLFTNGSLMTEELFAFCQKKKVKISTSLQGLLSYGSMTGTDRNCQPTLELIAYGRQNHWKVSVSITVTQANRCEIKDLFAAAALSGAETIHLGAMMPEGRGRNHLELTLSRPEWDAVKEEIRNMKNCGVPYSFSDEMLCECRVQPEELLKRFKNPEGLSCPAEETFGVIGPGGTYRKCLHYYHQKNNGK